MIFLRFKPQIPFIKSLKYFLDLFYIIIQYPIKIHQGIIQVGNYIFIQDIPKYIIY